MFRKGILFFAVIALTGCASEKAYNDYAVAYSGYLNAVRQQSNTGKLIEITAIEGQNIELRGVKSFIVYAPPAGAVDNGIRPPQQIKDSEWTGSFNNLVSAGASVGLGAVIGNAVKGIVATSVNNAGHNTSVTTTTSSSDSHDLSVVANTTTTSTDSHNIDSHNTTTTDSHNTTGITPCPTCVVTVTP